MKRHRGGTALAGDAGHSAAEVEVCGSCRRDARGSRRRDRLSLVVHGLAEPRGRSACNPARRFVCLESDPLGPPWLLPSLEGALFIGLTMSTPRGAQR